MISINVYEISMQIINFCILWFFVSKFLVRPLATFLYERSQSIENDIKSASNTRKETEKLLSDQKEEFAAARLKIKQMRKDAELDLDNQRAKLLAEAKQEANNIVLSATKEIDQNVKQAKSSLVADIGIHVISLCRNFLKRELTESDQKSLVSQSLGKH
jgi:F-type H+-transporting ATPase subunit b